ncbi:GumC family protein [Anaeromyxobacter oryzae]|uniref:Lipopolysaccharide biosynthesis protein n=1 Tax=Anaeromyxobacter oryzae TaxID=2918170 RepID=A0ABM7WYR2_9BACT|nr:lipopolysaccharide biosynthesis protein [Anaeromyxobacter oryzae]BDG04634.1 hypothetical protein AMOR_36300 [Anaeromyxobacter oryzae]
MREPGTGGDSWEEEGARPRGPTPAEWTRLVLGAARRRKLVTAFVFACGLAACAVYYRTKTPVYRVQTTILAQRQQALPSNVRPTGEDAPTRFAWEIVHRRENLLALVDEAGLLQRPPPVDSVELPRKLRAGASASDDPRDRLARYLDEKLQVTADEGTITITLDWPDAQQGYLIVQGALQNFIEARHLREVTSIDEVISVLRGHVVTARENLDRVLAQVQREQAQQAPRVVYRDLQPAPRPDAMVQAPDEDLVRLKSMLEAKQRAIQDVEEFRRRRLADLQAQLDERRNTYSDAHPSVIGLRRDIDSLSRESPQITALREEEAKLRKEYAARSGRDAPSASPAPARVVEVRSAPQRSSASAEEDERVREARFQYQRILERVNAAQLELDAVRAAFKYRYNVIWPPEEPRTPVSPDPTKVFGLGTVLSIFLAVLAAAWPDVRGGRIVERWQIERELGVPILSELRRP